MALNKARGIGTLGALFAAIVLPLVAATPAQAISKDSCVVVPLRPYYAGEATGSGKKVVRYPIDVDCDGFRWIEIEQRFLERDITSKGVPVYSEFTARNFYLKDTGWFGIDEVIVAKKVLPYQDGNGDDEVLHEVRIRIWTNGAAHNWSGWEKSGVRSITY